MVGDEEIEEALLKPRVPFLNATGDMFVTLLLYHNMKSCSSIGFEGTGLVIYGVHLVSMATGD